MLSMEFFSCKIAKVICLYIFPWFVKQPDWLRDPVSAQRTDDETFPTLVIVCFCSVFFFFDQLLIHWVRYTSFRCCYCNLLSVTLCVVLSCFCIYFCFCCSHFDFWLFLFDSPSFVVCCSNFINSFHALPPSNYCFSFSLALFFEFLFSDSRFCCVFSIVELSSLIFNATTSLSACFYLFDTFQRFIV